MLERKLYKGPTSFYQSWFTPERSREGSAF